MCSLLIQINQFHRKMDRYLIWPHIWNFPFVLIKNCNRSIIFRSGYCHYLQMLSRQRQCLEIQISQNSTSMFVTGTFWECSPWVNAHLAAFLMKGARPYDLHNSRCFQIRQELTPHYSLSRGYLDSSDLGTSPLPLFSGCHKCLELPKSSLHLIGS